MKLFFPDYAVKCLNTIENSGFEAWFVGGAVRDALLNREFFDIDITTNALPEDIIKLFPKTVPTGIKHGTVTVITHGKPIEVTTYRSDIGYTDNRHPESVRFEKDIAADLSRRDFTINALAYHPKRGILDYFDGINDLKGNIIRAVGEPELRFKEDALRILRALRFASVLDFEIEEHTLNAVYKCAHNIKTLSGERVLTELKKLSCGENPAIIDKLIQEGYLSHFGIISLNESSRRLSKISLSYRPSFLIALCNTYVSTLKENLKPDNELLKNVLLIKDILKYKLPDNKADLKRIYCGIGEENIPLYLEAIKLIAKDSDIEIINDFAKEISKNNEPFSISHLKISGSDLLAQGYNGEQIGKALQNLLEFVIDNPDLNDTTTLLSKIN